jgi:Zn-dependent M28 family amino/carboxypeptidase
VSRETIPAQSSARFDDGDVADELAYRSEAVFWSTRDSQRVSVRDSDVVFVGHGVVAPEYGWNDYAGLDVRGKTVVMLINDPGFRLEGDDFQGRTMTYYGRHTYKFEEAARQGAEAAIIVHQTAPAAYPWAVVEGGWSGPQLDLPRTEGAVEPVAVSAWITVEQARELFSSADLDFDEMEEAATRKGFTPVDLGDVTFSSEIVQELTISESANIAGVLPGTERPGEYVLYTAHWDHLGVDPTLVEAGEDGIFNGAIDNATGTAAILAIAESYARAGVRPKRSQIFLAVTAEESGLLGAKSFAANPPVPLASIVGGINIDAALPVGPARDLTVIGYGSSELEDILADVAGRKGIVLKPDASPEKGYFYRSDHVEFAKRGVPMLYVDNGLDLVDGGVAAGRKAADRYTDVNYHKASDEYDPESWRFDGLASLTTTLRDVGAELATMEDFPNWYEGNEFRPIRDAQLRAAAQGSK